MTRKEYGSAWRVLNKEKITANKKAYYLKNKQRCIARSTAWYVKNKKSILNKLHVEYAENREIIKDKRSEYYLINKKKIMDRRANNPVVIAHNALRRAARRNATPEWVDKIEILNIYKQAADLTKKTGVRYSVDHIWPLYGDGFNGLHVPWNLKVIPLSENCAKNNKRPL